MKNANRVLWKSIILIGFVSLFAFGCSKDDTETIDDDNFYKQIAYALSTCYVDIYNQNVAGQTVGEYNKTVNGPMGGTVVITGSANGNGQITTLDLVYSMSEVNYLKARNGYTTNITITGASTHTGSISSSASSENFQSSNLHITGTVKYENSVRNIENSGVVSINRSFSSVSANIFGNTVSW